MNEIGVANRLAGLRNQLGQHVADSMIEMVIGSEQAMKESTPMKGIWYPQDYINAFGETQSKWVERLRENGSLVDGWMPQQFWEPVYDQIGLNTIKRRAWTFLAKKDVLPSDAIKAAKVGLCILECGAVCQIARYDALLKALGEDKFNRLFDEKQGGQRINVGYAIDDDLQPMKFFVDFTETAKKAAPGSLNKRIVKIGQIVLFHGVSEYHKKHPNGMGANYNVICMDDTNGAQKYIGHGLSSKGETEEEIALRMAKDFNQQPNYYSRLPESVKGEMKLILEEHKSESLKGRVVNLKRVFMAVEGFDRGSPQDFCLPLVADLIQKGPNEISMDYVKRHPGANHQSIPTTESIELLLTKLILKGAPRDS